jgi:hypothetical protein
LAALLSLIFCTRACAEKKESAFCPHGMSCRCHLPRTLRSSSFSPFISFSFALTDASSARCSARLWYDVRPEAGRNAFFVGSHDWPAACQNAGCESLAG